MDARTQAIFRRLKANPADADLQEQAEAHIRRIHCDPDARFQADLAKGGRLWSALVWEMQFSRISVRWREDGGSVMCRMLFSNTTTHVRIWYPSLSTLTDALLLDDVRIVVSNHRHLSDVIESLEDNFTGATVVSALVSASDPDGYQYACSGFQKPKRSDLIDKAALRQSAAVGSTRNQGHGLNPWVGG